jgi:peptide/nickel transport system permease protein
MAGRIRGFRTVEDVATIAARIPIDSAPPTSLLRETLRRFLKHRPAVFGTVILSILVVGVLAGPFVYRVPIDEIAF